MCVGVRACNTSGKTITQVNFSSELLLVLKRTLILGLKGRDTLGLAAEAVQGAALAFQGVDCITDDVF